MIKDVTGRLKELTWRLLRSLALSLGLEQEYFVNCHQKILEDDGGNWSVMRSLYYPAITGKHAREENK